MEIKPEEIKNIQENPHDLFFDSITNEASKKLYVSFNKKNDYNVIVRLPKIEQEKSVNNKGIKPLVMVQRWDGLKLMSGNRKSFHMDKARI